MVYETQTLSVFLGLLVFGTFNAFSSCTCGQRGSDQTSGCRGGQGDIFSCWEGPMGYISEALGYIILPSTNHE